MIIRNLAYKQYSYYSYFPLSSSMRRLCSHLLAADVALTPFTALLGASFALAAKIEKSGTASAGNQFNCFML